MVTIRLRYEHGYLIPLDPIPDVEDGDIIQLHWKGKQEQRLSEAFLMMLASEDRLRRLWDTPEEDEAWADL